MPSRVNTSRFQARVFALAVLCISCSRIWIGRDLIHETSDIEKTRLWTEIPRVENTRWQRSVSHTHLTRQIRRTREKRERSTLSRTLRRARGWPSPPSWQGEERYTSQNTSKSERLAIPAPSDKGRNRPVVPTEGTIRGQVGERSARRTSYTSTRKEAPSNHYTPCSLSI